MLLIYQFILEPEGYDIRLASSAFQLQQVMDNIASFSPDLIVLDYHFRGYSHPEPLWQQLKAYPPTSALPMILCTADANVLYEQEGALREARVRVVLKPFDIAGFLHTIWQALQERSALTTA